MRTFPPEQLSPPFSSTPQTPAHPLPISHDPQESDSVHVPCCTPGERVPRHTSRGHLSHVHCPELICTASRSSRKHPECLDLAFDGYLYWGIPSFTCDLPGPGIPLVTSGHEVATHLPSVLIGLSRRTESLLQVTSARAVLPQLWAWFRGARGVCAGLRTQLCTTHCCNWVCL